MGKAGCKALGDLWGQGVCNGKADIVNTCLQCSYLPLLLAILVHCCSSFHFAIDFKIGLSTAFEIILH